MFVTRRYLEQWGAGSLDLQWLDTKLTQLGLEVESMTNLSAPQNVISLNVLSKQEKNKEVPTIFQYSAQDAQGSQFEFESALELELKKSYAFIYEKKQLVPLTPALCQWNSLNIPLSLEYGEDFHEKWSLDDTLIEFSLTPNRGDCLSYIGILQEIALAQEKVFSREKWIESFESKYQKAHCQSLPVDITLNPQIASSYHACQVHFTQAPQIDFQTYAFLVKHGQNPKNFGAALTNMMMLMFGQPMHAFECSQIPDKKIKIDFSALKKTYQMIDGSEIKSDQKFPCVLDQTGHLLAVAGVVGTSDSAVCYKTTSYIFESASFYPEPVRPCRKLGVVTDSQLRFERGVCPNLSKRILLLAQQMMASYDSEVKIGTVCSAIEKEFETPKEISLSNQRIRSMLGSSTLDDESLKKMATLLSGHIQDENFKLQVPSYRYDLTQPCDLAEEIMRVDCAFHHDRQEKRFEASEILNTKKILPDHLVSEGFFEILSYGFSSKEKNLAYNPDQNQLITLDNPISNQLDTMNTSLLINLCDKARGYQSSGVKLFESAWVFQENYVNKQQPSLAMLILPPEKNQWFEAQEILSPFYQLKNILEYLSALTAQKFTLVKTQHSFFEEDFCWTISFDSKVVGRCGVISLSHAHDFDWPLAAWAMELDPSFIKRKKMRFQDFSRYPKMTRDLSFSLKPQQSVDFLVSFIQNKHHDSFGSPKVEIFDYFRDRKRTNDCSKVGIRLIFQSKKKTLTDKEIEDFMNEILQEIEEKFGLVV